MHSHLLKLNNYKPSSVSGYIPLVLATFLFSLTVLLLLGTAPLWMPVRTFALALIVISAYLLVHKKIVTPASLLTAVLGLAIYISTGFDLY